MLSNRDEDKRFSFGIGMKLILTATLIMSVAVAVIGTLFHGKYVESLQEIEMTRLEQRAQELTEDIALILVGARKLAFNLATLHELQAYESITPMDRKESEAARSWMDRMRFRVSMMARNHRYVSSVHFIDFSKDNREFFAAKRIDGDFRAVPERMLKKWEDFEFAHQHPINGPADIPFEFVPSNTPLEDNRLSVAIPLVLERDEIIGAVVVSLDPQRVNDKLASRASRDEFVHVVYKDGSYLTNRNGFELGGSLTPTRRIEDIFPEIPLQGSENEFIKSGLYKDASGEPHAIGIAKFALKADSQKYFILAYSENFDIVIENTSIAPSKAIITSTIILLAAVLLIGYLANRLVNPLRYIARVARHYGETNEPAPLPIHASGEVGIVARSLHQMREQVEKRAHALEREIDAHKATSRELEVAMEETKEAAKAKSDFLATMSHEIRTPMNGVIGMADLLAQTKLSDDQKELVKTICSSGDSLLTIINDILDFSKIESGKMELEDEPFDPNQCIEEAIDLLASNALENDIELIINVAPDVPQCILGDITRLRQIILNLLGNALKFTHQGEVEVGLRVSRKQDEDYLLEFYVRDTGIGIPQEKQSKLFDAFSQVDSSTTREYGGTGLGLAISSRLANLMGGSIRLDSEALIGSTFYFTIKTKEVPYPAQELPRLKGLHGLILDAKENHGKALENQLLHFDISTEVCETPSQAKQILDKNPRIEFIITNRILLKDIATLYRHANLNREPRVPFFCLFNREQSNDPALNHIDSNIVQIMKPVARSKMVNALHKHFETAPRKETERKVVKKEDPSVLAKKLPLRILVADDNATNQYCAHELLSRLGYEADIADNGEEAVTMSRARNYDVVFMDVRMPIMDGLEATRKIRSAGRQMKQPHVIALTANVLQEDRDACFDAGMDDFIAKPVRFESIRDCLLTLQDKISLN